MVIHPISIRMFWYPKMDDDIPPVVHPRPGREISDLDISVRPVGRSSYFCRFEKIPSHGKHQQNQMLTIDI